jgi:hypothetical protein
LAALKQYGDGAEALPGSTPAAAGGVKILEEKFFKAVRDAVVAVRDGG